MGMKTTLKIDIWTNGRNKLPTDRSDLAEMLASHAEHVASMLEQGYTSGQVVGDKFDGWWTLEAPEHYRRKARRRGQSPQSVFPS